MKKIIYLGVVALTVYLSIMYEWKMGVNILSAEVVFPFICIGLAFLARRKVNVKLSVKKDVAEQKENLPIQISVENQSMFPIIAKIIVTYRYVADSKVQKISYPVRLDGKKSIILDSSLTGENCGKLQIGISRIKVFDMWGFFSFTRREKESQSILIMPKPYPVNLTVSSRTKWFPIDGESYARDRSGDDSAEIYEVREYRAGDRMQKVHWKLSAKEDDLYIKEFSYPLGAAVVLMLEEGKKTSGRQSAENLFIPSVISISRALLEQECAHYIVWREKKEEKIQRRLILDEEDFYVFLLELLEFEHGHLESDMEEYYRYEYRNETYSTMVKITSDLFLQINAQEPMDMLERGVETFFETMELVV